MTEKAKHNEFGFEAAGEPVDLHDSDEPINQAKADELDAVYDAAIEDLEGAARIFGRLFGLFVQGISETMPKPMAVPFPFPAQPFPGPFNFAPPKAEETDKE